MKSNKRDAFKKTSHKIRDIKKENQKKKNYKRERSNKNVNRHHLLILSLSVFLLAGKKTKTRNNSNNLGDQIVDGNHWLP